jgi:GMP synthase (glutamine-hydrolysing)
VPSVRVLAVQPDASDPPARLGEWLHEAGVEVETCALDAGDRLPEDLGGYGGVIVLGGAMGALDDEAAPFLPEVRAMLRRAVAEEVPTLGVCLGHQLLAVANGGQIRRMPDGPEIGAMLVAKRAAASSDPLFRGLPITPDVLQWHFDEVSVLPPRAIQLASAPGCDQQAFRLGRLAWGIQFHIETTPEILDRWAAESGPDELPGDDLDAVLARARALDDDLIEAWQPFAAAFAEVVRDPAAVSAPRGAPMSMAPAITDPAAIRAALAAEAEAARGVLPLPTVGPPGDD